MSGPVKRTVIGEWVVPTRWGVGDPIEWFPIDVARIAAAGAEEAGDRRLAEMCKPQRSALASVSRDDWAAPAESIVQPNAEDVVVDLKGTRRETSTKLA